MINLAEIFRKGEDSRTQFKRRFSSINALASEIAAMANTDGGKIFVGISDDGKITGVENIEQLNQWISSACSQKLEPPITVTTENEIHDDRRVVIINVPRGTSKPYAVNKSDFWIKVGADKRRASREELKRLMQASETLYADEMPVYESGISDLDLYFFREFYRANYDLNIEQTGLSIEKILSNLKLMRDDRLTLAGLLLFGKRPQSHKPQYTVKAVAFPGTDMGAVEYLDSEDIDGPLPVVFKSGMSFMARQLRKLQKGRNVNTTGVMEIPKIALEEAYVNALIHRDYFIDSGIRLFVFADRVEIVSPGKLPNTLTPENIKYGIHIVRNPILMSMAGKVGIPYRGIGSGIIRMIRECRNAGIPIPRFIEHQETGVFKVVFIRAA